MRFILGMADEDLRADIEKYFALLRDHFNYRRKDLEVSRDEGLGVIRTPDFEYSIQAFVDAQDTSNVLWRRELRLRRLPDVLTSVPLQAVFGEVFESLVCELVGPLELEAIIDSIEEKRPAGVRLNYDSQCCWCELFVEKTGGRIRIERLQLIISGTGGGVGFGLSALLALLSSLQDLLNSRLQKPNGFSSRESAPRSV